MINNQRPCFKPKKKYGINRCNAGSRQRRQRRNAPDCRNSDPGCGCKQTHPWIKAQQYSECGRHSFSTFETQEYWKQVAEKHSQRNWRGRVHSKPGIGPEYCASGHCHPTFTCVTKKGEYGRRFFSASQYIGRPRVFRAIGARIGQMKYPACQDAKGNGTQQISQQYQSDQSHLISGTSRRARIKKSRE